jgi:HSP20 family protein
VLIAEVSGLRREDIDIQLHQDRITLSGARLERPIACEQYHRIERGHGRFSRTFQLPHTVDSDGVTADLADGVLTITIPKTPAGDARRVHVS